MKAIIFIFISLLSILIPNQLISQSGIEEELFNETFPELKSIYSDSIEYYINYEKEEQLKLLQKKLRDAFNDLDYYLYEGNFKNAQVFKYNKSTKDLNLEKLKNLILNEKKKLRAYLAKLQGTSEHYEMIQNMSLFQITYKSNNMDVAYHYWNFLFHNYPSGTMMIYSGGPKVLEYKFEQTKDSRWIDTLVMLYDQRIKYKFFGKNGKYPEGYILGRKGITILEYTPENVISAYNSFKKSVQLQGVKSEDAVLLCYMKATEGMFILEKINATEVIENFISINTILEEHLKDPTNNQAPKAVEGVKHIFKNCRIFPELLINR